MRRTLRYTFHAAALLSVLLFVLAAFCRRGFHVGRVEGYGNEYNVTMTLKGPQREPADDWELQPPGLSIGRMAGRFYYVQVANEWAFVGAAVAPVIWIVWLASRRRVWHRRTARGFPVEPAAHKIPPLHK